MIIIIKIVSEKTAITNGTSKSAKLIVHDFSCKSTTLNVLDFGSGKLRNSKFLASHGFNVSILDTPHQCSTYNISDLSLFDNIYLQGYYNTKQIYDIVLCSYVLNVIENIHIREKVLLDIYNFLKPNGIAYIEVRTPYSISKSSTQQKYLDGFVLGKGDNRTFQKPFTLKELETFISINSTFTFLSKQNWSNSIFMKLQK